MTPFGHDPMDRGPVRGRVDRNIERTVTSSPCHRAVTRCLRLVVCRRCSQRSPILCHLGTSPSSAVSSTTTVRRGRQQMVPTARQTHFDGVRREVLGSQIHFVQLTPRSYALSCLWQPRPEQVRHRAKFVVTAHRTRRASLHPMVLGGEHQINARIARIVSRYVTSMHASQIRTTHHAKVDRGIA